MIKKFLFSVGVGAGMMWLADPQNGARRRRQAKRRLAPVLGAAEKLPEHLPGNLQDQLQHVWGSVRENVDGVVDKVRHRDTEGIDRVRNADVTPDPTSMAEFTELARQHGVTATMRIADGSIVCGACGTSTDAGSMDRLWLHRFEGATNPADMSTASALRCPSCSAVGLLVTGYGPNATPEESDVIVRLQQPRDGGMAPFMSRVS